MHVYCAAISDLARQLMQAFCCHILACTGLTAKVALLQGHIAATSPTFGHTLPTVFPEPSKFSPDRFKQDPNIKVCTCFHCI